jgi:hypothetical protein
VFEREGSDRLIMQHDSHVFNRACRDIGIEDFHWHDLRHIWAGWHVQQGTPLMVLKALGGFTESFGGGTVAVNGGRSFRATTTGSP